jgi:hypothetical protein
MSAGPAVAAALPRTDFWSAAGAITTMRVLSLFTSGRHTSTLVSLKMDAGMSPAAAPSVPSVVNVPTMVFRCPDTGKLRVSRVAAATNVVAMLGDAIPPAPSPNGTALRRDGAEVVDEHERLREPEFQAVLTEPLVFAVVSVVSAAGFSAA